MTTTSKLSGFFRLDLMERRRVAADTVGVSVDELGALGGGNGLADQQADQMVENAIGVMTLPLGLCVHLQIDGREHLVPMATEEPAVVAGCSYAAKLLRAGGGVRTEVDRPLMTGQVQLLDVADSTGASARVLEARAEILALANEGHEALVREGGGAADVEVRHLPPLGPKDPVGSMLVVHLLVDVRGTMGAGAVTAMCERVAPRLAQLAGGRAGLRALTSLSDRRLVHVVGRVPLGTLEGKGCDDARRLAQGVVEASVFAERDPYRAAAHNKGIMNGVDATLVALGQDWRAVEAGAHAYAARSGRYTALSTWRVEDDELVGRLSLPMAVTAGESVMNAQPTVRANRKLCAVSTTAELASVVAAAGLAQNLAALRALAAEGLQRGHHRVQARSLAVQAGAGPEEVQQVVEVLTAARSMTVDAAREVLEQLRAAPCATESEVQGSEAPPQSSVAPPVRTIAPEPLASPADREFCAATLPGVSRTFALSIQALPADLRDAICVAYLLCRVVDTVEDDRRKTPQVRGALFDMFDRVLSEAREGDGSSAVDFEEAARAAELGVTDHEKTLCHGAGSVFRTFASLPDPQREAIFPSVLEMSRGMRSYSERADREGGLKLRDLEDLEKYCYYVAGTVGELLTALFALSTPVDEATRAAVDERAVSFGLGLQLVNILKDVAEDALRGDCFLPQKQAAEHGLELASIMAPSERSKGLALLRSVSARARQHLDNAEEYTLLWPSVAGEIRLFCTVPLALALATLREVELGDDALLPNRAPTVTRALVMKVFEDAVTATRSGLEQAQSDRALRTLFDRSRTGIIGRPPRPASAFPSTPPPPSSRAPSDGDGARAAAERAKPKDAPPKISDPRPAGREAEARELGATSLKRGK